MVTRLLLPRFDAELAHPSQVLVSLLEIFIRPQRRAFPRRDDGSCPALVQSPLALTAVVGSVGVDPLDLPFDLLEQAGQTSRVNDIFAGDEGG